ncbi:MAG: DUF1330 domain-containing protein [Pseudomonadota bacterium]
MTSGGGAILVTVRLWVSPGQDDAFQRFEAQAFAAIARYGAEILAVTRPPAGDPGAPTEIHEIRFPSCAVFAAYREDDGMKALAPLRASAIERTEVEIAEAP